MLSETTPRGSCCHQTGGPQSSPPSYLQNSTMAIITTSSQEQPPFLSRCRLPIQSRSPILVARRPPQDTLVNMFQFSSLIRIDQSSPSFLDFHQTPCSHRETKSAQTMIEALTGTAVHWKEAKSERGEECVHLLEQEAMEPRAASPGPPRPSYVARLPQLLNGQFRLFGSVAHPGEGRPVPLDVSPPQQESRPVAAPAGQRLAAAPPPPRPNTPCMRGGEEASLGRGAGGGGAVAGRGGSSAGNNGRRRRRAAG